MANDDKTKNYDKTTGEEAPVAEVVTAEAAEPEAMEPEVVVEPEPEAAKPEAAKPEAAKPEAAKPEAAKPEAAKPEPAEPDADETAEAAAAEAPAAEPQAPAAPEPEPEPARVRKNKKRLARPLRHTHSKPAREQVGERKPITREPKQESAPGRRQERRGVVVSDKGDKSIVVKVEMIRAHRKYKKVVRTSSRLHAHDEQNSAGIGDLVRIVETRPLSKTKRWRLAEIVEKAK
jgi:small subunit ribosomal protein S17